MNFSPFGSHFPGTIPIHQFAAKFSHEGNGAGLATSSSHTIPQNEMSGGGGGGARYHSSPGPAHFANQHHAPISMPVNMGKYSRENPNNGNNSDGAQSPMMNTVGNSTKYLTTNISGAHHYTGTVPVSYTQQAQHSRPPSLTASPSLQVMQANQGLHYLFSKPLAA